MANRTLFFLAVLSVFISTWGTWAETDPDAASNLLQVQWHNKTAPEKLEYINQLKDVAAKSTSDDEKLALFRQIGDVYYKMERFSPMMKWYGKAFSLNSDAVKNSPVPYRMEVGSKVLRRRGLLVFIYAVYGVLLALFLISARRMNGFNQSLFLKRLLIFIPLFLLGSAILFFADFAIVSKSLDLLLQNSEVSMPKPIIPFAVFDLSNLKVLSIILGLGALPILIALFYNSFQNSASRVLLAAILSLTIISTWSHFIILQVFDKRFTKNIATTKTHLFFKGEVEDILINNPRKALKANPEILSSGNSDLDEFIRENNVTFPKNK